MRRRATTQHHALAALAFCLLVGLICTLAGCSTVTIGEEESERPVGQIVPAKLAIVHTGAIRGAFEHDDEHLGLSRVAQLAHDLEDEGFDVLLLDSGDTLGGTDLVDLSDGETAVGFLNAAGYDALTLGAHELAWGRRLMATRQSQSDFALLSANVTADGQGTPVSGNTTFKLSDGRLVGVLGITSPTAGEGLALPQTAELSVSATDPLELAQQQVATLRSNGCKLVICLCNLGEAQEGGLTAAGLALGVSGIDVVLDAGGTSSERWAQSDASGDEVLVVQTPSELRGATVVSWERGTLDARTVTPGDYDAEDEQVETLITQTGLENAEWLGTRIATGRKSLAQKPQDAQETPLGDLVADAALWEGRHAGALVTPDAALVDEQAIARPLPTANITRADALQTCPAEGGRLYLLQTSGADLTAFFESLYATESGAPAAVPQVAGLQVKVTRQDGSAKVELERVGSQDFSKDATYALVVTQRIACGEGPYAHLLDDDASAVSSLDSHAGRALINYLTRSLHGTVPSDYDKPQGRLPAVEGTKQP